MRAKKHVPPEQKPDISAERYDLTDAERKAVDTLDIGIALRNGHASSDNQRPVPVDVMRADTGRYSESALAEPGRTRWRKS